MVLSDMIMADEIAGYSSTCGASPGSAAATWIASSPPGWRGTSWLTTLQSHPAARRICRTSFSIPSIVSVTDLLGTRLRHCQRAGPRRIELPAGRSLNRFIAQRTAGVPIIDKDPDRRRLAFAILRKRAQTWDREAADRCGSS